MLRSASQNACSSEILVRWPAITRKCFERSVGRVSAASSPRPRLITISSACADAGRGAARRGLFRVRALAFGCAGTETKAVCRGLCLGFRAPSRFTRTAQIDYLAAHVFFRKELIDTIFSPTGAGSFSFSSVFTARGLVGSRLGSAAAAARLRLVGFRTAFVGETRFRQRRYAGDRLFRLRLCRFIAGSLVLGDILEFQPELHRGIVEFHQCVERDVEAFGLRS